LRPRSKRPAKERRKSPARRKSPTCRFAKGSKPLQD
jgi:hypothetical protein